MSANEVARQLDYRMTGGWGEGDRAANDHYRPIETYRDRINDLFGRARGLGFDATDLWTAHLNPAWATEEHVEVVIDRLEAHDLRLASLAWWMGPGIEAAEAACRIAVALGRPIIGGGLSVEDEDRPRFAKLLERHDLRFGLENHPERTPDEVLQRIDGLGERVGATVDTGWFGTQGYDAAEAILRLGDRVFHVHLKDVREVGEHRTCALGDGIVPIERCLEALQRIGYRGAISIEHEPDDYDPSEEVRAGRRLVEAWLARAGALA